MLFTNALPNSTSLRRRLNSPTESASLAPQDSVPMNGAAIAKQFLIDKWFVHGNGTVSSDAQSVEGYMRFLSFQISNLGNLDSTRAATC